MKFSFKIVIGTMLIIIVMFSIFGILLIHQNFINAFSLQLKTNMAEYDLERYSIETLISDYVSEEGVDQESLENEIYRLNSYLENSRKLCITMNEEELYSNIPFDAYEADNGEIISYMDMKYVVLSSAVTINKEAVVMIAAYDITPLFEARNQNLIYFYLIEAILLILCAVLIILFARFLTKPIQSLNEAAKLVTSGNLDATISVTSNDEIGELAASFMQMIDAVKKRAEKLSLAVKQREDFIANFTHELKTPMTSIMGYTKILRQNKYANADKEKALDYIYSETKRLELLSHKLLELMELSAQSIQLEALDTNELFLSIQQLAYDRLHIHISMENEKAVILGDKELLTACIMNLLENAEKASEQNYKIVLSGQCKQNGYQITIIDHGIGIAENELKRISESFYTVDKARSKANGGYGLGLSLCNRILQLHNSELHFESEIGKGTAVSFFLEAVR